LTTQKLQIKFSKETRKKQQKTAVRRLFAFLLYYIDRSKSVRPSYWRLMADGRGLPCGGSCCLSSVATGAYQINRRERSGRRTIDSALTYGSRLA